MRKFFILLVSFVIVWLIIVLALYPDRYIECCYNAIKTWALIVLPALLPFFFLTMLLAKMGQIQKLAKAFEPITKFLYKCNGISAFVQIMSFISGYPIGAKLIAELYQDNLITKNQATKMSTFCSTSGPLFILGSVGVAMFNNKLYGLILFLSHILSSVINGVIFSNLKWETTAVYNISVKKQQNILYDSCYSATISCLIVGSFIAFFYLLSQILLDFNILNLPINVFTLILKDENMANGFVVGLIECTKGCQIISKTNGLLTLPLTCCIISFGGICVIMQSIVFLKQANANIKIFILSKLTQTCVSFIVCLILLKAFNVY